MAPPWVLTSNPSLAITCRSRRSVISVVPNASAISATETTPRERTLSAIRRLLSAATIRPMVRHQSTLINSKQKRNHVLTNLTESVTFRYACTAAAYLPIAYEAGLGGEVQWVIHGMPQGTRR